VILDGEWGDPRLRRLAEELATATRSVLLEIACTAPTPQTADAPAMSGDDWVDAHRIDTRRGLPECTNEAEKLWRTMV
jgi:uncharacterized protein